MEDDEFEMECMALEAIFSESFRREEGRKICVTVEPVTADGNTLEDWVFTLILDVPLNYPEEVPVFKVASLENTIYSTDAKKELTECLEQEAEMMKGDQMVYNLVEWLKENLMHYVELSQQELRQTDKSAPDKAERSEETESSLPKKEKMSKAQKRRFYSKYGAVDEKPRGWDWVDIIAHLSSRPQTQQS